MPLEREIQVASDGRSGPGAALESDDFAKKREEGEQVEIFNECR